jgi:hypothetical protein
MAKKTSLSEGQGEAVPPEVADDIVNRAREEGVSPEAAEEIIEDAVSEGVAPDKLKEVAEDAIRVECEDQEDQEESDR